MEKFEDEYGNNKSAEKQWERDLIIQNEKKSLFWSKLTIAFVSLLIFYSLYVIG